MMSQVLPLPPENDSMPVCDSKYSLQTAGMLKDVAHANFQFTFLAATSYGAIFKS